MNPTVRLLLDAIRHRLDVACVHVTYVPIAGAPEIHVRAGRPSYEFKMESPYQWGDTLLYRTEPQENEYVSSIIHFGNHGSASILQLVHAVPLDVIFDKAVGEHIKFHAALLSNADINVVADKFRLNLDEKIVIACAARGLSVKETAKLLEKNVRTVEYRLNNAKAKLGVRTTSGAVYSAIRSRQLD